MEPGESLKRATEPAEQIAGYPAGAVQGTKRVLNQWLRSNFTPVFEQGLALEFLRFPVAAMNYGTGTTGHEARAQPATAALGTSSRLSAGKRAPNRLCT